MQAEGVSCEGSRVGRARRTHAYNTRSPNSSVLIIATAFIHLPSPAFTELGDPCLSTFWEVDYPWPAAFSMMAVFSLFLVELVAMRVAHIAFASTDAFGREDKSIEDLTSHRRIHVTGTVDMEGQYASETPGSFDSNTGQDSQAKLRTIPVYVHPIPSKVSPSSENSTLVS